jgi:hypothetical protein
VISKPDIKSLKSEVNEIVRKRPDFSPDNAFVLWFLQALLVDDEKAAADCITGGSGDKGADGIFVDHANRKVFIIQGKYHAGPSPPQEGRSDLIAFADLAVALHGPKQAFSSVVDDASALVKSRLSEVHSFLHRRSYALEMYYVTGGKVSSNLAAEAQSRSYQADGAVEFNIYGRREVLRLVQDYADGAPPVPNLDLIIESGDGVQGGGIVKRFDRIRGIEAWIFSMLGSDVGQLFARSGVRLFSRNIRGFLGNTDINRGMKVTLDKQPGNFWYYNNGVTLVCDGARKTEERGREVLRVSNPQIINGQQTTRMLKEYGSAKSSVLMRVIAIPRNESDEWSRFDQLVGDIVAATNWQNEILQSDLRSNDREQVRIEREMRRLNYHYLRKRQSKSEVYRNLGVLGKFQIKKEDLAKAVAACEFDPLIVREGKEGLFEDPYYHRIFNGRPAREYLAHLWLDRRVRSRAAGRPERAYARWLALNFVWSILKDSVGRNPGRDTFLYLVERSTYREELAGLDKFIEFVFRTTSAYFRANRGRGSEAQDASVFFKHSHHHENFERFWMSSGNRFRSRAAEAMRAFKRDLDSVSEDD